MLKRLMPARLWWFGLLLIAGLGTAFYLTLGQVTKSTISEQLLGRKQTIARAEAANITTFFQAFGDTVAVLAQLPSIERRDATTQEAMDVFVKQWSESDLFGGVVLTNQQGIVQLNSNISGTYDVSDSLADRDYFSWAKNQSEEGAYYIGQSVVSRVGASKDQIIVPVASPVFQNGIFTGVIAASVKLQPLTESYLELMKVSETDVYLANEDGNLLYSNSEEIAVMETNIFDLLDNGLENSLCATQEGKFQTKEDLIVCSPVLLGDRNWMIVMVSPVEDVGNLVTPIYVRQVAILMLVSMTILFFGIFAVRESRLQKTL